MDIARRHNVFLVEGLRAIPFRRIQRETRRRTLACLLVQFYPGKNLGAYGEGGQSQRMTMRLREAQDDSRPRRRRKYDHEIEGITTEWTESRGGTGRQAETPCRLDRKPRSHARRYNELLKDIPSLVTPKEMSYAKHVTTSTSSGRRTGTSYRSTWKAKESARASTIPSPCTYRKFSLSWDTHGENSSHRTAGERVFVTTMYPELTEGQIEFVCDSIRSFYD